MEGKGSTSPKSSIAELMSRTPPNMRVTKIPRRFSFHPPLHKMWGPRYTTMVKYWTPTLMTFGACGAVLAVYMFDWKQVAQFIPYYGGKYAKEENP